MTSPSDLCPSTLLAPRQWKLLLVVALLALPRLADAGSTFVINEVVVDPKSDWDDSTGPAGVPFDGTPGPLPSPTPSANDEYIEIKNTTNTPQSLAGYQLLMDDGVNPGLDDFDPNAGSNKSQYYRLFAANGALQPDPNGIPTIPANGYLVLGNPADSMNLTITVTLKFPGGATADQVHIGGTGNPSGDADSPANEALSRFPDGIDTLGELDDFLQRGSTLGRSNGAYCTVQEGDAVLNEVIGDPQSNWDRTDSNGIIVMGETPFNGSPLEGGTVDSDHDEYIEIKNTSGGTLSLLGCALDMEDTSVASFLLQDVDAPAVVGNPQVRVFNSSGALLGAAAELDSVPNNGYVVLGDPPGQMNATGETTVTLRNGPSGPSTIIDAETFGGPAPDLDASGPADESVSRFPDGNDTDEGTNFLHRRGTLGGSNGTGSTGTPGQEVINEVVVSPHEDYNADTEIDTADQAIELLNKTASTIDLTGWRLRMLDSSPVDGPLTSFAQASFSAGGSFEAWKPGEYLTLIDPSGQMNPDVHLTLFDYTGTVIDDVEIGGNTASTDYEGDGVGDGAPDGSEGVETAGVGDSSIARLPNGTDTNNDLADFGLQEPTLGATNNIVRNDAIPPSIDPTQTTAGVGPVTAFHVSGIPQIAFTEAVNPAAVRDGLVLLRPTGVDPNEVKLSQELTLVGDDKTILVTPNAVLHYATSYDLVVLPGITDRAGNAFPAAMPTVVSVFTTEPAPGNGLLLPRINEVVVDPQRDWDDADFKNPDAAQGSNTSLDEWIELINSSSAAQDLSNWTVTMVDNSRAEVRLGDEASGRVVACFNSSGTVTGDDASDCYTNVPPGGYVVIGDPPGSLSSDVYLELRNPLGTLADTIEIGGATKSSDYGGDGEDNGAPSAGDGDSLGLHDEAVARVPNATDTGNELTDWSQQRATLGRTNALPASSDNTAPTVMSAVPTRTLAGGIVRVDTDVILNFSEPMNLSTIDPGTVSVRSDRGITISFEYSQNDTQARVHWTGPLKYSTAYTVFVRGFEAGVRDQSPLFPDKKGNPMTQDFSFTFTTEPEPAPVTTGVMLNEIVTDPQQDWDDSILGPGVQFDAQTFLHIATSGDEWIELFNKGAQRSLAGWTIGMKDSDYAEHQVGDDDGTVERYSGAGGSGTIVANGYVVFGDPPNSMLDTTFVGLRNPSGVLVDAVSVDGAASSTENEAFARFPNGQDTNLDVVDFENAQASILAQNQAGETPPQPAVLRDVILTEISVDPQSDWNDSGGTAGQPFDPTPFTGPGKQVSTSDEYVELANISDKVLKIKGWTVTMVDSSPAVHTITGSSPSVEFYSAGATADSFPPGAILVIGNPTGSMNNDVFVVLEDARGKLIDKVEVGGTTADTNWEADDDRDGEVDEDRKDGEDDDFDGLVDEDPVNEAEQPGDGIPRRGDGNADSPANEAFHRTRTTGVDVNDWRRGTGSPGTENLDPVKKNRVDAVVGLGLAMALALGLGGRKLAFRSRRSLHAHAARTGWSKSREG